MDGSSGLPEGSESNGLGNLADELAEAFDEDEEPVQGELIARQVVQPEFNSYKKSNGNDRGHLSITLPPSALPASNAPSSPPKPGIRIKHRQMDTQYDGSDYGDDSELESVDGMAPSLDSRLAAVEDLSQKGIDGNGDNLDNLVQRFADSLKELPSQSRVENGVTRYATRKDFVRYQ